MNEADSEIGAFQIIMDNLNIQQKTRHKTLESGNKVLAYACHSFKFFSPVLVQQN
jgi:hypothetical protein